MYIFLFLFLWLIFTDIFVSFLRRYLTNIYWKFTFVTILVLCNGNVILLPGKIIEWCFWKWRCSNSIWSNNLSVNPENVFTIKRFYRFTRMKYINHIMVQFWKFRKKCLITSLYKIIHQSIIKLHRGSNNMHQ